MTHSRTRLVALLVVALLVTSTLAGVAAAAETPPRFRGYAANPTVQPGTTEQVTVQLLNQAAEPDDSAETAQNVEVWFTGNDTPFTVVSGRQYVGDVPDNTPKSVTAGVRVPANVSSGSYDLAMHVRYEYQDGTLRTVDIKHVKLTVPDRPRFRVVSTESVAPIGDTGTVNVTLKNVGNEGAFASSVALQSTSPDVVFNPDAGDKGASGTRYVGSWPVGQTRTVSYKVSVGSNAEQREYALSASVAYDDPNGTAGQSRPLSVGVTPRPKQSFSVSDVTSSLRVGEDGTLQATVTNLGPQTAHDAVVRLTSQGINVHPQETEYAVGTLAAGDSKTFSFPIEVSDNAGGGPRRFSFVVDYQNRENDARRSDTLTADAVVAPSQKTFRVEPKNGTLTAGSSGTFTMVVTNRGNDTLTNINAKAFTNDPLSSSDDEAFVPKLAPGESAEVQISLSAGAGALTKTYPLSVDFQYDQPDGDTVLSDTYRVPVDVRQPPEQSGPSTTVIAGVVVVLVLVVGGVLWWRRRS